jgi:hypothetical protein
LQGIAPVLRLVARFRDPVSIGFGPAFLSHSTMRLLMRPRSGLPPMAGYGLGRMTARDLRGRLVRFHFGAGSGATALAPTWPNQQASAGIMGNLGHARLPFNRLVTVVNRF